ncbi:protein spitz-like isoform X2 [Cylas formicarius]|nr:protein spitz-like isoform X2 [Cylas formicarius]
MVGAASAGWGGGWCLPRRLTQPLATGFHRFLARFSGRRRSKLYLRIYPPPWSFLVLVLVSSLVSIVEACSSRTTPKPRPPAPTPRPNITFHTYECPPAYATWFCLNGATCFTVKIGDSLLYNCECAEGYMGSRCEYKDLDGSYMPSQRRFMLETASIAGGATIAVFSVVILCVAAYLHWRKRQKSPTPDNAEVAKVPGMGRGEGCAGRPTSVQVTDAAPPQDRGDHHNHRHHHHQDTPPPLRPAAPPWGV